MKFFRLLIWVGVLMPQLLLAQGADVEFGKNRVQYKDFNWRYYSAENFDIYFYDNGNDLARQAAEYLEEEFDKITDLIGYPPYSKTKIFLYNSIEDKLQSNVGLSDVKFDVGGETKFIQPYVEVANPGTASGFEQELTLRVSQYLVNDMLFGGSLKDMFQNTYLLNLPQWFVLGISEYIAKGWNEEMDDYVRETIPKVKVNKLTRYSEQDAKLIGHSIWNFIVERYGRSNISNILNYTRIIRNEEKSISASLEGISFKAFMAEWADYYIGLNSQISNKYVLPDEELSITKNARKFDFNQIKISPDGKNLAYAAGKNGKYKVVIVDIATGKETVALRSGTSVINQQINHQLPVIDWADENTLGIVNNQKGKILFWLYDINAKNKYSRHLQKLTNVKSISFNDNGRLAIVSADVKGQNDLYLISTRRDRTKRLTHDFFDDITPSFVPGSNVIVFSSNRTTDTLQTKNKTKLAEVSNNFNLYFYSLDTTRKVLQRVTNTLGLDYYPVAGKDDEIFYLSDQKGITNVYKYNLSTKIYTQVTNYQLGIRDYDINTANSSIAFVMLKGMNETIYFDSTFNMNANIFTPASARKQILLAKQLVLRRQQNELAKPKETTETPPAEELEKSELEKLFEADIENNNAADTLTEIIDTDDYVFEQEVIEREQDTGSFLAQYRNLRKKDEMTGPYPYEPRFSADNLVTSFIIDPLWGFGIKLNTQMNDILEDHKISGGAHFTTNFTSGKIFAEYQYLGTLIDYKTKYTRSVVFIDPLLQRYAKNEFEIGLSYPFNVKSRVTLTPFYTNTRFDNSVHQTPFGFAESQKRNYAGGKLEVVYDNSLINELNAITGTRMKAGLHHYESLTGGVNSFSNFYADLRHYQKIHREIVLATKVYFGSFFGRDPQMYMVGGMENWLLRAFSTERTMNLEGNSPLNFPTEQDNTYILFSEFVTNLRGFKYASLYGNRALVANIELRLPIIRYLQGRQVASNFFRNLQFIGFYDIGSSWTGKSPFDKDNSIGSQVVKQGPFEARIKNFRSPWLSSYGVGLRTVLLGYYLKFDLAWPVEDFKVRDPKLMLTLGLDF